MHIIALANNEPEGYNTAIERKTNTDESEGDTNHEQARRLFPRVPEQLCQLRPLPSEPAAHLMQLRIVK